MNLYKFCFKQSENEGQENFFLDKSYDEYKIVMKEINAFLIKYRREYLKTASLYILYIAQLVGENVYPDFNTNSVIGSYQKFVFK